MKQYLVIFLIAIASVSCKNKDTSKMLQSYISYSRSKIQYDVAGNSHGSAEIGVDILKPDKSPKQKK